MQRTLNCTTVHGCRLLAGSVLLYQLQLCSHLNGRTTHPINLGKSELGHLCLANHEHQMLYFGQLRQTTQIGK